MRKAAALLIALIISMTFALDASGQEKDGQQLLPILLNGKWGFIDRTGKIVIEPKFDTYDYVYQWSEGLLAVRVGGRWGFIDKTGGM